MRFRLGLVVGFGTGYYLGAMAGRERYEQMNRMLHKLQRSDTFEVAAEKAKAAVDLGVERARDVVDSRLGDGTTVTEGPQARRSPMDTGSPLQG